MILILLTGIIEKGGIQRVSKHYVSALAAYALSNNQKYYVISLNDDSSIKYFEFDNKYYKLKCCNRNKFKFFLYACYFGFKSNLLLSNHKNLAIICKLIQIINPKMSYMIIAHGREIWDYPPTWISRISFNSAARILAVSNYTKRKVSELYSLSEDKIEVIHNALDPELVNLNKANYEFPFPDNSKVLLTVSRLNKSEPGKGVDLVIRSLPNLIKKIENLIYVVIGSGDLIEELSLLAKELNIDKKVFFIEKVNDEILYSYYKRCDLFVMPSKQEGFGLVFIEAMYFKKPVIGCEIGGVTDIIDHGKNGYLIQDENIDQLSEYIIKLLIDKNNYNLLASNAEKTVHEKFMFNNFKKNIYNLFDNIY